MRAILDETLSKCFVVTCNERQSGQTRESRKININGVKGIGEFQDGQVPVTETFLALGFVENDAIVKDETFVTRLCPAGDTNEIQMKLSFLCGQFLKYLQCR